MINTGLPVHLCHLSSSVFYNMDLAKLNSPQARVMTFADDVQTSVNGKSKDEILEKCNQLSKLLSSVVELMGMRSMETRQLHCSAH